MAEVKEKKMSKKENDELRRIVKGRFELVNKQISQRRLEVENQISEAIQAEFKKEIAEANKQAKEFEKRMNKLNDEWIFFIDKCKERGIEPDGVGGRGDIVRFPLRDYNNEYISFMPIDLKEKIRQAVTKLTEQQGAAKVNLREQELTLLERLMVNNISSEEAISFLEDIPDIDTYLPLVTGKKLKELL